MVVLEGLGTTTVVRRGSFEGRSPEDGISLPLNTGNSPSPSRCRAGPDSRVSFRVSTKGPEHLRARKGPHENETCYGVPSTSPSTFSRCPENVRSHVLPETYGPESGVVSDNSLPYLFSSIYRREYPRVGCRHRVCRTHRELWVGPTQGIDSSSESGHLRTVEVQVSFPNVSGSGLDG